MIPLTWNDAGRHLSIGARAGSCAGMPPNRAFSIVLVGPNHGSGVEVTAAPDQVAQYDGSAVVVSVP